MSRAEKPNPVWWTCRKEDDYLRVVHHHGRLGYICDPKVTAAGDTIWACWKCKESITPIEALATIEDER